MSRKTISKKFFRTPKTPPKFTRQTKRLFKKFTNENAFFDENATVFGVCKHNLPILHLANAKIGCFCAHFCLFLHDKKRIFRNSKFHLPILKDSKKLAEKGIFLLFCESCTIFGAYFLHTKRQIKTESNLVRGADFKSHFPKNKYFDKKRKKKSTPQGVLPFVFFTSKIR